MNIDDEVMRLLRLHPAIRQGVEPDYHEVHWKPAHAVPRRPTPSKPTDEALELQVAADLARIDAEFDRESQPWVRRNVIELGAGKVNSIAIEDGDLVLRVTFTSTGTGTINKAPA